MSRPIRLFVPAACAVLSLGFTACVGTLYDRMYSNRKTYYKPPAEKKEVSADAILGAVDATTQPGAAEGLMPAEAAPALPAPGGDIPGMPPAMPADPAAPPPPAPPMAPPPP